MVYGKQDQPETIRGPQSLLSVRKGEQTQSNCVKGQRLPNSGIDIAAGHSFHNEILAKDEAGDRRGKVGIR